MKKLYIIALSSLLILGGSACSDSWISDVVPTDVTDADKAVTSLTDGRNAINGVFSALQSASYYGAIYTVYGDLKGPDVRSVASNRRYINQYLYKETADAAPVGIYDQPYYALVNINKAIKGMKNMTVEKNEEATRNEILGNAYALRALCHFDLLKLYAKLPTCVDGDLSKEMGIILADDVIGREDKKPRSDLKTCYNLVVSDLKEAIKLIPADASTAGWFNQMSAKALLARVDLYLGQYDEAAMYAKEVINSGKYSLITKKDYMTAWYNGKNPEAILEVINLADDNADREAVSYCWAQNGYNSFAVADSFVSLFKEGDVRLGVVALVDPTDPKSKTYMLADDGDGMGFVKYPLLRINNVPIIRLSEMYFIVAECALKNATPDKNAAADAINAVLKERVADRSQYVSPADISIDELLVEKRKEFVGEGQAFFDLIRNRKSIVRTGSDQMPDAPKLIKYDDYRVLLPIPTEVINSNGSLLKQQNPHY